jgi:lysophospholipase L1-like esterase
MRFDIRLAAVAAMIVSLLGASAFAQTTSPETAAQQKGLATKAIEAAKGAATAAGDILTRVPCLPAKGLKDIPGSLPRVARRIAADEPVTIVAFGSSTTVGFGTSSPAYTYPNRLADQLRRKFPTSDITIINRGMGGQDAPEMMRRFDAAVLDADPDLVIWQLGTNTVVKGNASDVAATAALLEDGIARLQAKGIDVVLIDPQYVPAVAEKTENASRMVKLLGDVAKLKNVSIFPRFEVMRQWHEDEKLPFDKFVIGDGLHMNDWGYACFAQLLGDTIIKSVGQVKAGVNIPSNIMTYRPM